jgi:hypothetical protein
MGKGRREEVVVEVTKLKTGSYEIFLGDVSQTFKTERAARAFARKQMGADRIVIVKSKIGTQNR